MFRWADILLAGVRKPFTPTKSLQRKKGNPTYPPFGRVEPKARGGTKARESQRRGATGVEPQQ